MEELAIQQGLVMIPEFAFDHALFQLSKDNFTRDAGVAMKETFSRIEGFLHLGSKPNVGITVVISPKWFFVAILTQPYS